MSVASILFCGAWEIDGSLSGGVSAAICVGLDFIATALGLMPLLFSHGTGSEVQRPLATVVLGGLSSSTLLTLLVIPALYKWFSTKPVAGESGPDLS